MNNLELVVDNQELFNTTAPKPDIIEIINQLLDITDLLQQALVFQDNSCIWAAMNNIKAWNKTVEDYKARVSVDEYLTYAPVLSEYISSSNINSTYKIAKQYLAKQRKDSVRNLWNFKY
jgi:hypothetical protein